MWQAISLIAWLVFVFCLMYFFSNWFALLIPFFSTTINVKKGK